MRRGASKSTWEKIGCVQPDIAEFTSALTGKATFAFLSTVTNIRLRSMSCPDECSQADICVGPPTDTSGNSK